VKTRSNIVTTMLTNVVKYFDTPLITWEPDGARSEYSHGQGKRRKRLSPRTRQPPYKRTDQPYPSRPHGICTG